MPRGPPQAAIPETVATTDNLPPADVVSPFGSSQMFVTAPFTAGPHYVNEWEQEEGESNSSNELSLQTSTVVEKVVTTTTTTTTTMGTTTTTDTIKNVNVVQKTDASTSTSMGPFRAITAPAYTQWDQANEEWDNNDDGLLASADNLGDIGFEEDDRPVLTAPAHTAMDYVPELLRTEKENAQRNLHAAWQRLPPECTMGPGSQTPMVPMVNPFMVVNPFLPQMFMPQMMVAGQQMPQPLMPMADPIQPQEGSEEAKEPKKRRRRRRHRGRGRRGRGKKKQDAEGEGEGEGADGEQPPLEDDLSDEESEECE